MQDLRKVVDRILAQWGLDVYLQRRIFRGGEGLYQIEVPDPKDDRYWSPNLEKYTVRMTFAGRRLSLADTMEPRQEGYVHRIPILFYFPYYANPNEGDRVYVKDNRYPNELGAYILEYCSPEYGHYGELTFYSCGALREEPR